MDTHAQFRDTEKRTFPYRAGVFAAAIGIPPLLDPSGGSVLQAAILATAATVYIATTRLFLLQRFRHDGWIYGQLAVDSVFAVATVTAFGPLGPAMALPLFAVVYYSMLLATQGAIAAVGAGLAACAIGAAVGHHDARAAVGMFGATAFTAGIAALLATDRFRLRTQRDEALSGAMSEARASRVLEGILRMSAADGEDELAAAVADAIRAATGYPASVVLNLRPSDGLLIPTAWCLEPGESAPATGTAAEAPDGPTAAATAARQGVSVSVSSHPDHPVQLPEWAEIRGYQTAIATPITRGLDLLGVCYSLRKSAAPVTLPEIEQAELVSSFAARLVTRTSRESRTRIPVETSIRQPAQNSQIRYRPPIRLPGVSLDPNAERVEIGQLAVSLSRTEFSLIYTLASASGEAVDSAALLRTCWSQDERPGENAVDVAVYRLRRKLGKIPRGAGLIRTIRGKGYALDVQAALPIDDEPGHDSPPAQLPGAPSPAGLDREPALLAD